MRTWLLSAVLFSVVTVSGVSAADAPDPNSKTSTPVLMQDATVKAMMDMVARTVARRYDLRPEQSDLARNMIEKNTKEFITRHYSDLLVLVPQMTEMRMKALSGQKLDPVQVREMARKVSPIYKEATDLIVSENEKFRQCLDDKQKSIHQRDMDQMKRDVVMTTEKLSRWKEGGYRDGDFLNPQRPRPSQPKKPETPDNKTVDQTPDDEKIMSETSLSYWELYVKKFIEAFQLNEDQKPMAYTVLNDLKIEARAYREDHSREFKEVNDNLEHVRKFGTTQPDKELKPWQEKLTKLEKPLLDMFSELQQRLMVIPSEEQRKAAQDILAGKVAAPKTQPASEVK